MGLLEQPAELGERLGAIVDPQDDQGVVEPDVAGLLAHDEERRRLPAVFFAAGRFAGAERRMPAMSIPVRWRPRPMPGSPQPPEAITGTATASETARVSGRS